MTNYCLHLDGCHSSETSTQSDWEESNETFGERPIMTHVAGHAGLKYSRSATLQRWEENELNRLERDYPEIFEKYADKLIEAAEP